MQYSGKHDLKAAELAHSLPVNTAVVMANIRGIVLYSVMNGTEIAKVVDEASEVYRLFNHDSEENK